MKLTLVIFVAGMALSANSTPQFSRSYLLPCSSCHLHVPKLNPFGERFLANGYRIDKKSPKNSIPAVWASAFAQSKSSEPNQFKAFPNRVELIAAGRNESARMSYFVEWRVLSREMLANGSLRDRSGRFEDFYLTFDVNPDTQLQIGQFRALSQVDVSRRLNITEPLTFSTSLAGTTSQNQRIQSLRSFSMSGRAPSVRLAKNLGKFSGVVTIPLPGEFSIPLTPQAKTTASSELEAVPKGVFLELFQRKELRSIGMNAFIGRNHRSLICITTQEQVGNLYIEAAIARFDAPGLHDWRSSVTLDWIPTAKVAAGARIDYHRMPGQHPALSPYFSLFESCGTSGFKLVTEARIQRGAKPRWSFEGSWQF